MKTRASNPIRPEPLRALGVLQRKCACGASAALTGKCEACRKKRSDLQRCPAVSNDPCKVPRIVYEVQQSPVRSLHPGTRAFFEQRFGKNVSHVHVRTDAKAAQSALVVGAVACFDPVYFPPGTYQLAFDEFNSWLIHELTNVCQYQHGI